MSLPRSLFTSQLSVSEVKFMPDERSNRIAVVCHCMMNVHSLETNLAEYRGLEEEVIGVLTESGFGIVQLRCPETRLHGVERLPMPKDTYDKPHIRESYSAQAREEVLQLKEFVGNGAEISMIVGAEASPSCGVTMVGRWKEGVPVETRKFPQDVDFIPGRGVYFEELEKLLDEEGIKPAWIGVPGRSTKKVFPEMFQETLRKIREL
jgi:predicted secreted protein